MGPLHGLKIVELAGIGPAPLCAMLLADLGATVLRGDRAAEADVGVARALRYSLAGLKPNITSMREKSPANRITRHYQKNINTGKIGWMLY